MNFDQILQDAKQGHRSVSYWARGDWTCENKHLNLFNLHSKVELSAVKYGPPLKLHSFVLKYAKYQLRKILIFLITI
jgi:hypothetical protein